MTTTIRWLDNVHIIWIEIRKETGNNEHCTCWSRCELVTSTQYLAVIKSLHSPPLLFFSSLFTCCGGVRGVCGVNEADCACVSEAVVLAEEGREAVSLRIRLARLALSRLPGSLKLFDDRTGQHHRRWRWGAGGWTRKRVVLVPVLGNGILSFVYSCFFHLVRLHSPPPPLTPLSLSPSSSIPLSLRPFARETPSSSLKELCAAAGHPGLPPG